MSAPHPGPRLPVAALRVVVPFCFGYYVSYLLRTVNAVIAPELVRELHLGAADLGLLTSTYFLAFAVGQLPVGAALDRFGARRVVAVLLALAAAGVVVFSTGHTFARLAIGRGLVGLGVSASLMGAFKAFGAVFPPGRQVALTGVVMAAGAVGALTASVPLAWALPLLGWRHALLAVALASALAALLIAALGRDGAATTIADEPMARTPSPPAPAPAAAATLGTVLRARAFWRFAPQAALFTGGFMAVQSLWAVPWFMTVDGLPRVQAATQLMMLNAGMLAGQLSIAFGATALVRSGASRERLMTASLVAALLVEGLLITGLGHGGVLWFGFGCLAAAGAQVYGVTASYFPPSLSGRVITAVNLLAFVGAFVIQWGIGVAIQALGRGTMTASAALKATFAALWFGQLAAVAWSAELPFKTRRPRPPA